LACDAGRFLEVGYGIFNVILLIQRGTLSPVCARGKAQQPNKRIMFGVGAARRTRETAAASSPPALCV
jgi:hypothetical protein